MWKFVYQSVDGTSHRDRGQPCQDACRVQQIARGSGHIAIIACADGAGSASHADLGARIACDRFIELVVESLRSSELPDLSRDWAIACCTQLRHALDKEAKELQLPLREVACTFLGAILEDDRSSFLQIGDGAMVIRIGDEGLTPVFWPSSGEYVNTTHFLSDEEFADRLQFASHSAIVQDFAAFTDGLERLALSFATHSVHEPFFVRMLAALRAAENVDDLFEPLQRFLDSDIVNDRTDDDKTLILGTRL